MKLPSSIDTENYYFVQIFYKNEESFYAGCEKIVVFATTPADAEKKVRAWCGEKGLQLRDEQGHDEQDSSIHLYHKNYKRDSRKMVEVGRYIA